MKLDQYNEDVIRTVDTAKAPGHQYPLCWVCTQVFPGI